MTTTTNREDAERIAATRNLAALDPMGWTVVDGPEDGEHTVMTRRDAAEFTGCDACFDGTPHGHECDAACEGCHRLPDVVGGCACADDDAPVTLRAMRLEARL